MWVFVAAAAVATLVFAWVVTLVWLDFYADECKRLRFYKQAYHNLLESWDAICDSLYDQRNEIEAMKEGRAILQTRLDMALGITGEDSEWRK